MCLNTNLADVAVERSKTGETKLVSSPLYELPYESVPLHHTGAVLAPVVADGCHWKLSLGPPSTEACQPLSYHLSLFSSFFLVNASSSAVVPTTVNIVSLARETLLSPAKSSPSDGLSPIHASNTILYSPGTWK